MSQTVNNMRTRVEAQGTVQDATREFTASIAKAIRENIGKPEVLTGIADALDAQHDRFADAVLANTKASNVEPRSANSRAPSAPKIAHR